MFLDESGFLLIPNIRKTWAPLGETPIHRHSYKRDRISAISAVTVSPKRQRMGLLIGFHTSNVTGTEVQLFLRDMLKHLRGLVFLFWDGGSIHRRREVQDFIKRHHRLHVYRFPAYAPELNPDEFVWTNAKRALSNGVPKDIEELNRQLRKSIRSMQHSQTKLRSCIYASELPWSH